MSTYFGFNPPFVAGNNILPSMTDERLIKNDLLQLLMTAPGERVMRSDFGTNIRRYIFEPLTTRDINALKQNILEAIKKYEQRVSATSIKINVTPDQNLIQIQLYCKLTIDPNRTLELTLDF